MNFSRNEIDRQILDRYIDIRQIDVDEQMIQMYRLIQMDRQIDRLIDRFSQSNFSIDQKLANHPH